jgi:hypothetical protein
MFHLGQDIVCIKDHSKGFVKEGSLFTVKGLRKGCCNIVIDVGLPMKTDCMICACGNLWESNGIVWISELLFKPLDELSDISELLEVLNKENYQEV